MLSRLPRWLEIGGFWLAAIAGAVNAIGLLGFRHEAVSHVTGSSTLLLLRGADAGHWLASAACGLQNAMVSSYSGALVRTTHMTGLVTDIGTMLGARLRGQPLDRRRVLLYVILLSGFLIGGVVGALAFARLGARALLLPAVGALALAAAYHAVRRQHVSDHAMPPST
jgi:uncharacterized membrane protein YoaK (UPF0700 family)